MSMPDLSTSYLGLALRNPLVASASPLSQRLDTVLQLEEAGIGAIVMHSLFEEQLIREGLALDYALSHGTESYAEALTYLPDTGPYGIGPETYLDHLYQLKRAASVPIIASLNGVSNNGWVGFAREIEQAGADALELNLYFLPLDFDLSAQQLEDSYVALVRDVRANIRIPLAVKLSPFFTALPHAARRIVEAGADGLVLFNRFYQPDIDLEELEVVPHLELSDSRELRLPLRWTALLSGRLPADFAITSGVHSAEDVLKAVMAGANVAMLASALLRHGPPYVVSLLAELNAWMVDHEYESVRQMHGSMRQQTVANPGAYERANYIRTLGSYPRPTSWN
jgi:dihydroorotate dehydrogenase (fumarate)